MITIKNICVNSVVRAIYAARNPMNSWGKSDSDHEKNIIGPNDLDLATRLIKAGPEHAKFLRMIHVQMDITGPLYWWKEMDTYKVATVTNSCSTMHKIHSKEFTLDDFSYEHLFENEYNSEGFIDCKESLGFLRDIIFALNCYRKEYLKTKSKEQWWQLIQLLPSSYNQLRTWDGSMQTILSILKQRKGHKLDEWEQFRQACFDNIPYCKEFYEAYVNEANEKEN